jgi:hypothetical protein
VHPEPAVVPLASEEAGDEGTAADLGSGSDDLWIVRPSPEELSERAVPDRRLLRLEQPFHRRVAGGYGHDASIQHRYIRNLYVNGKVAVEYGR